MVMRESSPGGEFERLGRYEILGEIASGGMATVFLGRVTGAKGFQRLVAIKRLHPHLESEEDFVAMFLDEARLAARIRHPNVVATLDVEDQAGLYIVMEYIEGDRLLGFLRNAAKTGERIPPPIALRIGLDTLAGLHAAHELCEDDGEPLNLVHRDVSPQNILVGVDGVARLTDFGIAKAASRLTVTRDGQLKGKIAYMAPEQTKRVEIDRRVDIFAMGIIMWEMLTSKKLFTGEADVEVLNQLLFEPIPRLKDNVPGLPAALDAAVMKALERDPAKRFATAAEFADALERASKIIGGAANARTVAQYVQKVAAEKLAKDRARIASAASTQPFVDMPSQPTGSSRVQRRPASAPADEDDGVTILSNSPMEALAASAPKAPAQPPGAKPPAATPSRKQTMMGIGVPAIPVAPPPPAPSPSTMAETSLVDDDEDIPTQALLRTQELAEIAKNSTATRKAASPSDPPRGVAATPPPPPPPPAPRVSLPPVPPRATTEAPASAAPAPPPAPAHAAPASVVNAPAIAAPAPSAAPALASASSTVDPSVESFESSPAPRRGANKSLLLVGALVVLGGGIVAAWKFTRSSSSGRSDSSASSSAASHSNNPSTNSAAAPPPSNGSSTGTNANSGSAAAANTNVTQGTTASATTPSNGASAVPAGSAATDTSTNTNAGAANANSVASASTRSSSGANTESAASANAGSGTTSANGSAQGSSARSNGGRAGAGRTGSGRSGSSNPSRGSDEGLPADFNANPYQR